jgi:hypothetical protein
MTTYGPPGRPGQGRPQDPYDQPADPWGGADQWDEESGPGSPAPPDRRQPGTTGYGAPAYDQTGHQTGHGAPGYGGYGGAGYGEPPPDGRGYGQPGYQQPGYQQPGYDRSGYDQPGYGQPGYGGTTYGGDSGHEPAQPSKRSSTRMLLSIVAALAVLVLGGAAALFYLNGRGEEPAASPSTNPAAGQDGAAPAGGAQGDGTQTGDGSQTGDGTGSGADPAATTGQNGTPAPEASAEARFAVKGQCLVNDGSETGPKMRIVPCAPNAYEVLARFDATIDFKTQCGKVKGYQFHYFFDSELNALDFVLCLKKR